MSKDEKLSITLSSAHGYSDVQIQKRILSVRGKQVMLDRDLAELYGVSTKVLNQAVKRNLNRFPDNFMLQLSPEEMNELVTHCHLHGVLHSLLGVRKRSLERGIKKTDFHKSVRAVVADLFLPYTVVCALILFEPFKHHV